MSHPLYQTLEKESIMDLSKIELEPVPTNEPREKGPNEFDPVIEKMVAAGPDFRFPVPPVEDGDVLKIKRRITDAAHRFEKSPRFTVEKTDEGTVIKFRLINKIVHKPHEKSEGVAEGASEDAAES